MITIGRFFISLSMKRIYLIVIVLAFGFIPGGRLFAQVDSSRVAFFPTWLELYYDQKEENEYGEHSNIDRFFKEWEIWSGLIVNGLEPNEYNALFCKHFLKAYKRTEPNGEYITLPLRVKVIKFDRDISPDNNEEDIMDFFVWKSRFSQESLPESISYFTPVIECDKKVLYLFDEVERLLSSFLDEPIKTKENVSDIDDKEVIKRRLMIADHIPAARAHWGGRWFFSTYPIISSIIVGNDGYYIDLDNNNSFGETLFVPWGKDSVVVSSWVQ